MDSIKELAEKFDLAIEQHNIPAVLEAFSDDCVIEILGVTLEGKEGAKKWTNWLSLPEIIFKNS